MDNWAIYLLIFIGICIAWFMFTRFYIVPRNWHLREGQENIPEPQPEPKQSVKTPERPQFVDGGYESYEKSLWEWEYKHGDSWRGRDI